MIKNNSHTGPALIADIGGTNARFAVARDGEIAGNVTVLACQDHNNLAAAANTFLNSLNPADRPKYGIIAVAAPVTEGTVQLTNLNWQFSKDQLCEDLKLDGLDIVNDFTAIAWAVPRLQACDRRQVGGGTPRTDAPIVVIGPGTGLGVSALVPALDGWVVLPTEGGHVTMAGSTVMEDKVLDVLRHKFGHVSAERVLSGPGLVNIYEALVKLENQSPKPIGPQQVSANALADPASHEALALRMFFDFLGTAASNAALSLDAHGGVYVAGGVVGNLGDAFAASGFRRRFEAKGRFESYVADIPTFAITHPFAALAGLAAGPLV